jgi:flagellin
MVVQHNMQAMNSNRMLGVTTSSQGNTTEKLSSGYKINRAADDAAGLAISEKMRKQARGLERGSLNAQDGVSCVQTAEGALNEVHAMLQRMNELAVQAANGTNSVSDRVAIQNEVEQLLQEIDRVGETSKFNETLLLKGDPEQPKNVLADVRFHTAGLDGELSDIGTRLIFKMEGFISGVGNKIKIGASEYIIDDNLAGTDSRYISVADALHEVGRELTIANKIGAANDSSSGIYWSFDPSNAYLFDASNGVMHFYVEPRGFCYAGGSPTYVAHPLSFNLHAGADADLNNKITVDIKPINRASLGLNNLCVVGKERENSGLTTSPDPIYIDDKGMAATYCIDAIADALEIVSAQRAELGAIQNRLEHSIANLDNVVENTTAAESRIRDTDMAEAMVEYSKNNILAQAGQSMLAQANSSAEGVMALLQ